MINMKCKYDRYSFCDLDEPDTLCDGCEYGLKHLETKDDEPDPDRAYEQARDEGRRPTT